MHELVTATREYPATARLDLQAALAEALSGERKPLRHVGLHAAYSHDTTTFANLTVAGHGEVLVAPLQYDEIQVGDSTGSRALRNGLWLAVDQRLRFAALLSPTQHYGQNDGWHLEIAVPPGEAGAQLVRQLFSAIDVAVARAGTYRGRVLSMEASDNYRGWVSGVRVHRLKSVRREEVILAEKTLALLERNVVRFIENREELHRLGLGLKKGLLFYGPPGTGKTHTIHYLAGKLPGHTTFLVTAEQVGLLDKYMQMARFLQPAIVVLEDVDLIARARTEMNNACAEAALNKLLNEMDGLREDARILFILTTNRPEELETALTARPGRIDQAIEFPLPDAAGRRQLVRLYGGETPVAPEIVELLVEKTAGGSGAFIKELMRRTTQFALEDRAPRLFERHVEAALDEILFSGGALNAKLLGFHGATD